MLGLPVHHQLPDGVGSGDEMDLTLTRWTVVDKVMSLLFNMLSRSVITLLSRSKHLLISWLQSPSAVTLKPPKIKSDPVPMFPHLCPMKWWEQMP